MTDRIIGPEELEEDILNKSLRPKYLSQYIGQENVKKALTIYIEAAKNRKESLDHVLLYGPPGLGKTTMAMVIANEMNVNIRTTSGPAIDKSGDLIAILNELDSGDILFIDEIHRLPKVTEEMLYSAMEDFYVDIMVGEGSVSRSVHFSLPNFTLIGATTRAGMLSSPLRDRFGIIANMEYYNQHELKEIIVRSSDIFSADITPEGALEISLRSRGTPRIANRLLKRVRDFAEVQANGFIDKKVAIQALSILQVDKEGLDNVDQKLLKAMIEIYNGGPVGVKTLSINTGQETETIVEMYEPYLIQKGFIKRTACGRVATDKAYKHFGYNRE